MELRIFVPVLICTLILPSYQASVPKARCGVQQNPFLREKCGDGVLHENDCLRQGCCFDNSIAEASFCFRSVNCYVGDSSTRQNCGWMGITESQCQCRGCCYDQSAKAAVKCFSPYPQVPTPAPTTTTPEPTKPPEPECIGKKMDLLFVLDESTSIDNNEFQQLLEFAKGVVEKLWIGPDKTQVGMITFSSSSDVKFTLRNHHTQPRVVKAIEKVIQRGGSTFTNQGIDTAIEYMQEIHGGRSDAIKVMIVETDGESKNKTSTKESAAKAKAAGVTMVAVGVGDYNKGEILNIASDPKENHAFTLANFDELVEHIKEITLAACKGTPPPTVSTVATTTINPANVPKMCEFVPLKDRKPNRNYMIDPDGPYKGADPFIVECDFTSKPPVTILHNAQEKEVCAVDCNERKRGCFVQSIQYRASSFQTRRFVDNAKSCTQYIKFTCHNSAIGYRASDTKGPATYWTNRSGKKMPYWAGGPKTGGCACAKDKSCSKTSEKCNCDSQDGVVRSDGGTITDMKALPVKEVAIGDVSGPGQKGCFTMGPLKCI